MHDSGCLIHEMLQWHYLLSKNPSHGGRICITIAKISVCACRESLGQASATHLWGHHTPEASLLELAEESSSIAPLQDLSPTGTSTSMSVSTSPGIRRPLWQWYVEPEYRELPIGTDHCYQMFRMRHCCSLRRRQTLFTVTIMHLERPLIDHPTLSC